MGSLQTTLAFTVGIISGRVFDAGHIRLLFISGSAVFIFWSVVIYSTSNIHMKIVYSLFMLSLGKEGHYYQVTTGFLLPRIFFWRCNYSRFITDVSQSGSWDGYWRRHTFHPFDGSCERTFCNQEMANVCYRGCINWNLIRSIGFSNKYGTSLPLSCRK